MGERKIVALDVGEKRLSQLRLLQRPHELLFRLPGAEHDFLHFRERPLAEEIAGAAEHAHDEDSGQDQGHAARKPQEAEGLRDDVQQKRKEDRSDNDQNRVEEKPNENGRESERDDNGGALGKFG